MDTRDEVKPPDIKLSPSKEIVESLFKRDRLPYAVIIGTFLFVLFFFALKPTKEIDASFWVVIAAFIFAAYVFTIHLVYRDKRAKEKRKRKARKN
jgi:amino acid transporter